MCYSGIGIDMNLTNIGEKILDSNNICTSQTIAYTKNAVTCHSQCGVLSTTNERL